MNGTWIAVGSTGEIWRLAGAGTRVIDLAGAFALPGFNGAHVPDPPDGVMAHRRRPHR